MVCVAPRSEPAAVEAVTPRQMAGGSRHTPAAADGGAHRVSASWATSRVTASATPPSGTTASAPAWASAAWGMP